MNNLIYDTNIYLMTLNILCKHYKVDIIFIKERTKYIMFGGEQTDILYMNDMYKFISYLPIMDTFYILNLEKPLYAISHYKLAELVDICKKLYLPHEACKKQLYESIYYKLIDLNIYKIE
jgi:hypothetical protein